MSLGGEVVKCVLGWAPFGDSFGRRKEVWVLARSEVQNEIGKVGLFQKKPKSQREA